MTGNELLKTFNKGNKIIIKFTDDVLELERMFQENMKAIIIDVKEEDGCMLVKVDQTEYYESNKPLGINTWHNKDTGEYNLNYEDYCKQNNYELDMIEDIYVDCEKDIYYFNII